MRRAHDPARLRRRRRRCAAIRSNSAVTPEACAASVSLRLATRSSWRVSPKTSSTTAPSASQASASAVVRNAHSTSAARTVTSRRGSRPSSASPLGRQRAGFHFGKILPHPDQRLARRNPPRKARDETGRRRALMALGKHLMHGGAREPAAAAVASAARGRARPCRARAHRHAFRCARCCRARTQACLCVRCSCAASSRCGPPRF